MTDDEIYDWVDDRFRAGEFDAVNERLVALDHTRMDISELITWLTVTFPAKSKLPARYVYYMQLQREANKLWRGLD